MKTIINLIKRLPRLFKKQKEPKLSVAQIDELIELNRDILVRIGDDAKIEPIIKKRKLHDK
jgi:hypothetical protein